MPVTIKTGNMKYKDSNGQYVGIGAMGLGDIEESVENWLDDHPEATTTVDFSIATKVFSSVADMVADETLEAGDNVATKGYYTAGDDGAANYTISASHTGYFYIELANGLYANMLSEKGILPAESIGIKKYASSTNAPNEDDMDTNVELFNRAHYYGIYLIFGRGHYYFSAPLRLEHRGTFTIQGIDRSLSYLHFPNSDGLYFCDARYYNYYVVQKLAIYSYGHCMVCDESCLTVLDSHFEWLLMTSETGDCFHGPRYNVAKYLSQGGERIVYDTCVQNCVFDFINASAPQGAAFCNIMGMYTYYQHMNFVSCKYAFRNCDGIVRQTNTLGSNEDYFIYYDKAYSHSLRWVFENVNAEGIENAFIYTEPAVPLQPGEDTKKPENAHEMTLSITAIQSGWSLARGGTRTGHDVYPITVHAIGAIELLNAQHIVAPSAYPNAYDTEAVKAHIKATRAPGLTQYNGGPDITVYDANSNQMFRVFGDNNRRVGLTIANNGGYSNISNRNTPYFSEIYSDRIYGGKGLNVWSIKASDYTSGQISPPENKQFFDTLSVNVDIDTDKGLLSFQSTNNSTYAGRIVTVENSQQSLHDLVLRCANNPSTLNQSNFMLSPHCLRDIRLKPRDSVQLVYTKETNPLTGSMLTVWKPIDKKYIQDEQGCEAMYNVVKATSSKPILPVTKGYFIKNSISTGIDVETLVEGKFNNANYGINNVMTICEPGDEFTIINGCGGAHNSILWSFVSASGARLTNSGNYADVENTVITAPANAAYLVVNSYTVPIVFKSN